MDDPPTSPHCKTSLPTFASSIPVEIAVLPASTRTSFTRVENSTRPGTAAGDNNDLSDKGAVPDGGGGGGGGSSGGGGGGGGSGRGGAPAPAPALVQPEDEPEEVVSAVEAQAAVVVPQVPQTLVQFLLVSGRRRSMAFVPETTVGRVKELVWNSWPNGTSANCPPSSLPPHPEPMPPIALALERVRAAAVSPLLSRPLIFFLRGGNFATFWFIFRPSFPD